MNINELKKILVVSFLYIALLVVFSIKTIYYYQNNSIWWVYAFAMTICFIYFVYHSKENKGYSNHLMLVLVVLFCLFPFELELTRFYEAIWGDGIELSGLGKMLPNKILGTFFDLLFFPVLIFMLMYLTKITYKVRN